MKLTRNFKRMKEYGIAMNSQFFTNNYVRRKYSELDFVDFPHFALRVREIQIWIRHDQRSSNKVESRQLPSRMD